MEYNTLKELLPKRKNDWKIKAKVTRKWSQTNQITGRKNAINIILVDENVSSLLCFTHYTIYNLDMCFISSIKMPRFISQYYVITQLDRMHVWIRETMVKSFDQQLIEGQVYEISNFVVKFYQEHEIYKCFDNDSI